MIAHGKHLMIIGSDEGLHVGRGDGVSRVDELAGREVVALARSADGWCAVVDGRELWRSDDGIRWAAAMKIPKRRASSAGTTPGGLLIGTARAHLLRLDQDRLVPVSSFEEAEGRDTWYTPWGAPAEVRSISAGVDGAIYVNVHVGGVLRSTDDGLGWRPMLDIEDDVHQVLAHPTRAGLVLVAAAAGFGRSADGGATWSWQNEGLHDHYCRAVTVAGDTVLVSASTGHRGTQAAVYRRRLDGGDRFERCQAGLPEWFSDNVDTGCLVARGGTVVIGTEDGAVFASRDAGLSWGPVAKDLGGVRAIAVA